MKPIQFLSTSGAVLALLHVPVLAGPLAPVLPEMKPAGFNVWSYQIKLPVSVGYDDNPAGLSNELPRAAGLSHRSSYFTQINPKLSIRMRTPEGVNWTFAYDLLKIYFHDQADMNVTNNTFAIVRAQDFNVNEALKSKDTLAIKLSDRVDRVDEEGQANAFSLNPSWTRTWNERHVTTLYYSFVWTDFALSDNAKVDPRKDPDFKAHFLGLTQAYYLRPEGKVPGKLCDRAGGKDAPAEAPDEDDAGFYLSVGYRHTWQDADGAEVDKRRNSVIVELAGQPFAYPSPLHKLELEASYAHHWDDYPTEPTAAGIGLGFQREDNKDEAGVVVTHPLDFCFKWVNGGPIDVKVFGAYDYSRLNSTVFGRDGDNHIVRFGVIGTF